MLFHPLVHLGLLAWYFIMKSSRGNRAAAMAMCAIGIAVAAADLIMLPGSELPKGRVMLGAVIDAGLAFLFFIRLVEAHRRPPN